MQPSLQTIAPPDASEHAPYYGRYISLVAGQDILAALEEQPRTTLPLFSALNEHQGNYRYAPDKWSVKELFGHVIDTERIMAYRAMRIARNDRTPIEGFEQDDYVRFSDLAHVPMEQLVEEFQAVRQGTLLLLRRLTPDAWLRRGIANNNEISVRALAYVIAGHELHHRRILQEKYLKGLGI